MGERSKSKGFCGWFLVLVVVALIAVAVVLALKKRNDNSEPDLGPVPGPPGAVQKKYGDALKVAMQFFDIQKCKFLIPFNLLFVMFNIVLHCDYLLHSKSYQLFLFWSFSPSLSSIDLQIIETFFSECRKYRILLHLHCHVSVFISCLLN